MRAAPKLFLLTLIGIGCATGLARAQPIASADSTDPIVAITAMGLASIQPVDGFYVGGANSIYLDRGLGGVGAGFGAGVSIVTRRRFVAAAEFNTARISAKQVGRLVGQEPSRIGQATSRLSDSLVSGLVGVSAASRNPMALFVAGLSWVLDAPTVNDVPRDPGRARGRLGFGGGVDVSQSARQRIALVGSVRYWIVPRQQLAKQIGVGPQIIRIGAGIRVRLTDW